MRPVVSYLLPSLEQARYPKLQFISHNCAYCLWAVIFKHFTHAIIKSISLYINAGAKLAPFGWGGECPECPVCNALRVSLFS